ncbi:MAG: VOC family protein [Gammaproteobacteria bacterium]|nr:VOC family protein [Gammaproteobacteria bacterium]
MSATHGDFIWYELMTSDADAAQAFYAGLTGWTYADSGQTHIDYRVVAAGDEPVGGILALSDQMLAGGARPAWVGYVQSDDLDGSLAALEAAGGSVMMSPVELPGVGRFAMIMDPQGASLYLIDDESGRPSNAFSAYEPRVGHCAWNELITADPAAARRFYGGLFGWVVADSMDMGPMGPYEMLKNGVDRDFMFGGMMKKPDMMPVSSWSYYFRVADIDAAAGHIAAGGGQVLNGPQEIPGGEFIINGADPQGAMFSIIGKRS